MATESSATIGKAFRVLQLFRDHNVMTVSICEQELGIPRSTAHRLLVSLRDAGAIEQIRGGHFVLSLELFELGVLAPQRRSLDDRVGVDVEALAYRTGYRVLVGVRRNLEVVYLEAANGYLAQSQGVRTRIGFRGPMHATSMGKIFLAYGGELLLKRVLADGIAPFTPKTIVEEQQLEDNLRSIRDAGFALSVGEFAPMTASLAVPIHAPDGSVTAALAIVGDNESILRQQSRLIDEARLTASRIERGVGGTFRYRIRGNRSVVAIA